MHMDGKTTSLTPVLNKFTKESYSLSLSCTAKWVVIFNLIDWLTDRQTDRQTDGLKQF